jgi:TfoX/Sxy family transcriptional regulator of competence genes
MASTRVFVDYVCEQAGLPGRPSSRKMFGEYALYIDGKVVALVCDNQVFLKPTADGKRLLGSVTEAPPYPGAKPHYQISEHLEDRELVMHLFLGTAAVLPTPKPKSKAPAKSARGPAAKRSPKGRA